MITRRDSKAPPLAQATGDAGMAPMEGSKLLIVFAAIILLIAISLSAISTKPHGPGMDEPGLDGPGIDGPGKYGRPPVCDALRAQLDWDDPAYRLLCSETGGGRNGG